MKNLLKIRRCGFLYLIGLMMFADSAQAGFVSMAIYTGADEEVRRPLGAIQNFSNHIIEMTDWDASLVLRGYPLSDPQSVSHIVLHLHGNAENHFSGDRVQKTFNRQFGNKKIQVYTLQYPGYSGSDIYKSEKSFVQAGLAAYKKLHSAFPHSSISIWGFSVGAGVATQVASRVDGLDLLVLSSGWTSSKSACEEHVSIFSIFICNDDENKYETEKVIADIQSPVVLFHGGQDNMISVSHSVKNMSVLRRNSSRTYEDKLIIREGKNHNNLHDEKTLRLLGEIIIKL